MKEILEKAANLMVKSMCSNEYRLTGECFNCEDNVMVELSRRGDVIPWVSKLFSDEFPTYKFMSDGVDKIIVLEL